MKNTEEKQEELKINFLLGYLLQTNNVVNIVKIQIGKTNAFFQRDFVENVENGKVFNIFNNLITITIY